ncbi:succinate dehydrogenase cytochrome b558 subunit [Paenibacillus sp. HJGM_3]|uniref:succinate dehydrogenase cytochrome b558 subunit n=1 Tax=Paenibacillus sp. HJGM_3 TaxID=3379816 RepID=UPI00385CE518
MSGNSYLYRKLHSLLGVIPVGLFLLQHMLSNYEAFRGGAEGHQAFIDRVHWLNSLPLVLLLEIVGIYLPILYHGVYGLYVAFQSNNNVNRYGYFRNLLFTLQRITGVITLIFIVWHVFETRIQIFLGNTTHEELGVLMHDIFTNPLWFTLYLIGIICAVFHFSNGMWSFLVSWGITVGPRAQRISTYVWLGVFVVMSVMFILTMIAFIDPQFQDTSVLDLTK